MTIRKALLIGINYYGSKQPLKGCHSDVRNMIDFIQSRGFEERDMVVLMDEQGNDPYGSSWPTGENIRRALQWLANTEDASLFLHYSGHGGRQKDDDGTGFDDTIVPVDYEERGQIDSDVLHQTLVTPLPESSRLHAIFDCCHSGSAIELPYVYRTDEYGNVSLVDNIRAGIRLAGSAARLLQDGVRGGFNRSKVQDAEQLFAGAQSFFKSIQHQREGDGEEGLGEAESQDYAGEHRNVVMYSGCRDDQTSADANIAGASTGAMSWAFLEVMRRNDGSQSYVDILRNTRTMLQQNYAQVPQLSAGTKLDLEQPWEI